MDLSKECIIQGGSPGLVVMGGDLCSKGCEFESWLHILDGHFYIHIFVRFRQLGIRALCGMYGIDFSQKSYAWYCHKWVLTAKARGKISVKFTFNFLSDRWRLRRAKRAALASTSRHSRTATTTTTTRTLDATKWKIVDSILKKTFRHSRTSPSPRTTCNNSNKFSSRNWPTHFWRKK